MESSNVYVLGSHPEELARLDHQAAVIERPTRLLLQAAGLAPGMRVLDLGTGLGHVARIAGELVGAHGAVVGVDRSADALAVAQHRCLKAGESHVTFVEGDVASWRGTDPFDAVVGRLVLFHLPDPIAIVRHHLQNLRPGGLVAAIDFDIGAVRTEPRVPFIAEVVRWIDEAFSAGGASPRIGARLASILARSGVRDVTTFGVQAYLQPHDPSGAALLVGVVRSLAPIIVDRGIATAAQLDLDHLDARLTEAVRHHDAVVLPPTVVGAWGRAQ
jgi:ubiquinone/menaquinone biosynthesis C-methylase UbiE